MVFFITATRTRKWYSGFISLFEVSSTKEEESLTWMRRKVPDKYFDFSVTSKTNNFGTSGVPKQSQAQQAEAKCYSSNNRMGLRAGANPSFTSQGTEAIINSINGSQCSVN
ncbi:hypothetical protein C5167_020106 [Papaver somniferum]|uniref:Uncharacterized protein n=1 Tax=Papaver somniferum TaxID=3469 RepID=A0A4Y7ISK8_PAPSO|nr:hypothetical protein C5167_020106 [Papaver somniferum]